MYISTRLSFAVFLLLNISAFVAGEGWSSRVEASGAVAYAPSKRSPSYEVRSVKRQNQNVTSFAEPLKSFTPNDYDRHFLLDDQSAYIAVNNGNPLAEGLLAQVVTSMQKAYDVQFQAAGGDEHATIASSSVTISCRVTLISHRLRLNFSLQISSFGLDALLWSDVAFTLKEVLAASAQSGYNLFSAYALYSQDSYGGHYATYTNGSFVQVTTSDTGSTDGVPTLDLTNLPEAIDGPSTNLTSALNALPDVTPSFLTNGTTYQIRPVAQNNPTLPVTGAFDTSKVKYRRSSLDRRMPQIQPVGNGSNPVPFDPQRYASVMQIPGSSYWIAMNYGPAVVHWLMQESIAGLRAALQFQMDHAGGPGVTIADGAVTLPWSRRLYTVPHPVLLYFQMHIYNFGLSSLEWRDVLGAFRLWANLHVDSLITDFVLFTLTPEGAYQTFVRGDVVETTLNPPSAFGLAPNISLAALTQPGNDTQPVDLSDSLDLSDLPDFSAEVRNQSVASLRANVTAGTVQTSRLRNRAI